MNAPVEDGAGLAELRTLLLGQDAARLAELQQLVQDPERLAAELAKLLPRSVAQRPAPDHELSTALAPTFEVLLRESVERDPSVMRDAVFPILGPAIRKAVAQAIAGLAQSINRTLEHTLSVRSLGWRLQAWRTGRPFAEFVLLHSLVFRVEHAFLVHRESGLLLQHVAAPDAPLAEADLVSGMVTAIRDFAVDSLHAGEGEELVRFDVGDLTMMVEAGPAAVLCVAVRGVPPSSLREIVQDALETIHAENASALAEFDGDATPFERAVPALEGCLQQKSKPRRSNPAGGIVLGMVGVVAVAALVLWWVSVARERAGWRDLVARLDATAGLVVVDHGPRPGGGYRLVGLRDPRAADPQPLFADSGLPPELVTMRWEAFLSQEFLAERAAALLRPPASVQLEVEAGRVAVRGQASPAWRAEAERRAALLAAPVDWGALQVVDEAALLGFETVANEAAPGFAAGITAVDDFDSLQPVADALRQAEDLALAVGARLRVVVAGFGDRDARDEVAAITGARRATAVVRALEALRPWRAVDFETAPWRRDEAGRVATVTLSLQLVR